MSRTQAAAARLTTARWWGGTLVLIAGLASAQVLPEESFTEAQRALGRNDTDAAIRIAGEILAREPFFGRAWLQIVRAFRAKGDLAAARPHLESLRARHPQACLGLASYWHTAKDFPKAKAEAVACTRQFPGWLPPYQFWALALGESKPGPELLAQFGESVGGLYAKGVALTVSDPNQALRYLEQARQLAPDRLEIDDALYDVHNRRKDLAGAREALQRLLARAEARRDGDWLARGAGRMAQVDLETGHHQAARQQLERLLPLELELGLRDAERFHRQLLGAAYLELGLMERAREEFERLLRYPAITHIELAAVENRLGQIHHYTGRHAAAITAYQQAVERARKAKDPDFEAMFTTNLALTYFDLGDMARSRETLAAARAIMPAVRVDFYRAGVLIDQATLEAGLGRIPDALSLYDESIQLATKGKNNEVREARARILRAELRLQQKLPGAEADLDRADALLANRPLPRELSQIALGRGRLEHQRGNAAKAITYYQAALENATLPLRGEAHLGLSDVHWKAARLADAFRERQQAIAVNEQIRSGLANPVQTASFLARRLQVYRETAQIALAQGRPAEAFAAVERGRARALLDLVSAASPYEKPSEDEYNLNAALTAAQEEYRRSKGAKPALAKVQEARQALRNYYDARREPMTGLQAPVTAAEIAPALPAGTALLHYTVTPQWSALFVVTRDGVRSVPLAGGAQIEVEARQWRSYLAKRPQRLELGAMRQLSQSLYARLIQPAERLLAGSTNLVIAADGPLLGIPFDALQAPSDARLVLERFAVQYAPSASALLGLMRPAVGPKPARELLAFADAAAALPADPVRSGLRQWQLGALPFAREEVRAAARAWRSPAVFFGAEASEAQLKQADLTQYRIVHFAVHGMLDEEHPRFSALALTPGAGEDGLLQLHEIRQLRMNAALVVLSACETGLGERIGGEGVVGLTHAFLSAGARSVIASLWRVDDRSTATVMVRFHEELARGTPPAIALRRARLAVMRSPETAHPFHWAGLVLSGAGL